MREPSKVIRAPQCPSCHTKTHRVLLAGKQAICINNKCTVSRFTVQNFGGPKYIKSNTNKRNKSYNNSGKQRNIRKKRVKKNEE